jgi:hypothetical protein
MSETLAELFKRWEVESPRLSRVMDVLALIGCLEMLIIMFLAPLVFRSG